MNIEPPTSKDQCAARPPRREPGWGLCTDEWLLGVVPGIVLTGAFVSHLTAEDPANSSGWTQLVFAATYALLLWAIWPGRSAACRVAGQDPLLWALTAWAMLSIFWSANPAVTAHKAAALLGTSLYGVYLASHFTLRQQLRILVVSLAIIATASTVLAMALPSYGRHAEDFGWAWRGIFNQKNSLGHWMSLGVAAFVLRFLTTWPRGWRYLLAAAGCLVLTFLSQSITSCLVGIVLALVATGLFLAVKSQWDRRALTAAGLLLAIAALLFCISPLMPASDNLLEPLGRDTTLTGRTDLWDACMMKVQQQPILGYGYAAFWLGWEGPSAAVWQSASWHPTGAHNGFLDLSLQLGAVGLVLFIAGYLRTLLRAFHMLCVHRDPFWIWPVLFLLFLALSNLTEATILYSNHLAWAYYVAMVLTVARSRTAPGLTSAYATAAWTTGGAL